MPGSGQAQRGEVPVPEPGLSPPEIIARARALTPAVREQQDEAERLGQHSAALDQEFVRAGFYRILQPRRFGGEVLAQLPHEERGVRRFLLRPHLLEEAFRLIQPD